MARKHKHEDHTNHEAWAIPYGDLVTLLLAFFVVMYAVSSVNEGKYRVLSESLSEAFGGKPRSVSPLQLGKTQTRGSAADERSPTPAPMPRGAIAASALRDPALAALQKLAEAARSKPTYSRTQAGSGGPGAAGSLQQMERIADKVTAALGELIDEKLVTVRRTEQWLEVEIKTDILFDSASASLRPEALDTIARLGDMLRGDLNPIRIEGHTDDRPIATPWFPSNWELSAARAASVLHVFERRGVDPARMTIVGNGAIQPVAGNDSDEGRARNRRVLLVIRALPGISVDEVTTAALDPAPRDPS